jgi:hypothetical protein
MSPESCVYLSSIASQDEDLGTLPILGENILVEAVVLLDSILLLAEILLDVNSNEAFSGKSWFVWDLCRLGLDGMGAGWSAGLIVDGER